MTQIIQKIEKSLKQDLNKAIEVWVAVAMVSPNGLNFLTKAVKKAKVNMMVGTSEGIQVDQDYRHMPYYRNT